MYSYDAHARIFAGHAVKNWTTDMTELSHAYKTTYAIRVDWDEYDTVTWLDKFAKFMTCKNVEQVPALVVGSFDFDNSIGAEPIVEAIAANRDKLPNLKGIFLGDILSEENEISWIEQGNLAPLLNAYPDLEYLTIRGANRLRLGNVSMTKLKSLRLESGGLPGSVVREIATADLPAIESIVIWLGTVNYGSTLQLSDLQGFYEAQKMPNLKYLGLCNSDQADEIAVYMATAPVLQRIETLDLSMGTLGDEGALALIKSPNLKHLKSLNLDHNYCTPDVLKRLQEICDDHNIKFSASQVDIERDWRFVAVGE